MDLFVLYGFFLLFAFSFVSHPRNETQMKVYGEWDPSPRLSATLIQVHHQENVNIDRNDNDSSFEKKNRDLQYSKYQDGSSYTCHRSSVLPTDLLILRRKKMTRSKIRAWGSNRFFF